MRQYFNLLNRAALVFALIYAVGNSQLAPALLEWDGTETGLTAVPQKLSQLGFDPAKTNIFIPYQLNVPQYRTYFGINRYLYLPPGQKIIPDDSLYYQFPIGTVFLRNVYVDTIFGDPSSRKWLELQVQVRLKDSTWGRLSYGYEDNSSDAVLVGENDLIEKTIQIKNTAMLNYFSKSDSAAPAKPPAPGLKINFIRSAFDCIECHYNTSANGFITQQLNVGNQLADLAAKGVLASVPDLGAMAQTGKITQWHPPTHPTATLDQKARAYLASNCGHCHSHELDRDAAGKESTYNYFTQSTSLENFNVDALKPGDPVGSQIVERMLLGEMPPAEIGAPDTPTPDIAGSKIIWDWINSLGGSNVPFPGIFVNVKPKYRQLPLKPSVQIERGIFIIGLQGISPKPDVKVFTLTGNEIHLEQISANRFAAKSALSPGIYLVKLNQITLLTRYLGP